MSGDAAPIGVLGAPRVVLVDDRGAVHVPALRTEVDWLVGVGDRWRRPAVDVGVRQVRLGAAPAVDTRLSVPGGDIVHRVFGVAGQPALAVVDVANESPAPVAVAIVLRGEPGAFTRDLRGDAHGAAVHGYPVLHTARPAQQHATAADEAHLFTLLAAGATDTGATFAARDRRRGVVAALVWPLAHRTTVRVAVPLAPAAGSTRPDLLAAVDAPTAVAAWRRPLERGMCVEHDDAALTQLTDASRATLLVLAGADAPRPTVDVAVACEDWGFDREAAEVWNRLSVRERRAARRREAGGAPDAWVRLRSHVQHAGGSVSPRPAQLLHALRDLLVVEHDAGVTLLPGFPAEWRGANRAVHEHATRHGPVSSALRWHGPRPALLWDAPAGLALTAPRLDPAFAANGGSGETLLAEPPTERA